jgi:prepilin-type N-terminal cleavage/methylation domain-containing protein
VNMTVNSDQRGFTLIEILTAIVVFAFGALALYRLQASIIASNAFSNRLTQAVVLAQGRIESLMALPYNHPLLSDTNDNGGRITNRDTDSDGIDDRGPDFDFGLNDTLDVSGAVVADGSSNNATYGITYNIYWNIAVDQPMVNVKTIRVIVTWRDGKSCPHRTFLTSMKAATS